MTISNLSAEALNKLYSYLPSGLNAEKIVFFPDVCPGRAPLPTGIVVLTKQPDWRKFAVSDCGCGMQLLRSSLSVSDFRNENLDQIMLALKANKEIIGDLGYGNHFLNAMTNKEGIVHFLVHTGSRKESRLVDHLIQHPKEFDKEISRIRKWARENRDGISVILEQIFGNLSLILDKDHNHFEKVEDGVIIRKGAVRVMPGELTVIPSNLNGETVLVQAESQVNNTLNSLNHGTGRIMSRSDAKIHSIGYNYNTLRQQVYIPEKIRNDSLGSEIPECYRGLDNCLLQLQDYISIKDRYKNIAYPGQL